MLFTESAVNDVQDESSNDYSSGDEPSTESAPLQNAAYPHHNPTMNAPPNTQATAMLNLLAQMTMLIQQKSAQNQFNAQQSQLQAQLQAQSAPAPALDQVKYI